MKDKDNSFEDFIVFGESMTKVSKNGEVKSVTPFTKEYEINLKKLI
jgi:hypothetical protein